MSYHRNIKHIKVFLTAMLFLVGGKVTFAAQAIDFFSTPSFLTTQAPPLVMLVMGRDHKLYYEAYNDYSDINEDGVLDLHYNPAIEYYGYFDSYKYYEYSSNRFEPVGYTPDKKAPAGNYWSGDFLNYLTMSRIDVMRKVLYGGYRSVDTATETVLERAYIPNDAHCWGKEYTDLATDGYLISDYTPYIQPSAGNRHLFASGSLVAPGDASYAPLLRVKLNSSYRVERWVTTESANGIMGNTRVGTPDYDFHVKVLVGVSSLPNSKNEKLYAHGTTGVEVYKPIGLLQRYGENEDMRFGLITGSYDNHLSGGVLRKNISSFTDEINPDTGEFLHKDSSVGGIVKTLDNMRLIGFNHTSNYWDRTIYNRPINEGENYMWGNPVGEMLYETLRYFNGSSATPDFTAGISDGDDRGLDLPLESFKDPYGTVASGGLGYETCAKPFMLVISDINVSYDTDQLPGVFAGFNAATPFTETFGTFDAEALADTIFAGEFPGPSLHYIGESNSASDTACSAKTVDSFGDIRGLCPEEPTKLGGYYSAAAAFYGKQNDINAADEEQVVKTFSVALASPLPKIEIPMSDDHLITLVPFAKSIYSTANGGISPTGAFQPTCSIVDFYVNEITTTNGSFTVTYEHAEQGSDFDLDATILYEYTKIGDTIELFIKSENIPGGSTKQHFGYIISGTTADGVYLDIKNITQPDSEDRDYHLDTPNIPGPLPNEATRIFTADNNSTNSTATLLKNPLYYAAKWGGYDEQDGTIGPSSDLEWDQDLDGVPDTYFYVTNPTRLEEQLNRSFLAILNDVSSGTAASVISSSRSGEGAVYQSVFYPEYKDDTGQAVSWAGMIRAFLVDAYGNMRVDMYAADATGVTLVNDSFRGVKQLNFRNEDLNYNGVHDTDLDEDANSNGVLDPGEDLNHNGRLDHNVDEVDYDGDGQVDYRDLIVILGSEFIELWDDRNENGLKDVEDEITFSPDIPAWHNNGIPNGIPDTEDINDNGVLDPGEDLNGNHRLDTEDVNGNGVLDTELVGLYDPNYLNHLNVLWNSRDWLDDDTNLDPLEQRSYGLSMDHRYIFTFVDADGDMIADGGTVADGGEVMSFLSTSEPTVADLTDTSNFYAYLNLYPSFDDKPAWVSDIEAEGNRDTFLTSQAKRVVDWIRGEDQDTVTLGSYDVPAMRSRQYRLFFDRTWRLGDIISSSPTLVGRPAEAYHLIYRDNTYAHFLARHLNRRSVVYAGGNDGMIHAFNGGFYDYTTGTYEKSLAEPYIDINNNDSWDIGEPYADWNNDGSWTYAYQTQYELGSELWAYVPFNQLPHLYWLTEQTYPHVYYNDLTPKIFDARIFDYNPADPFADPNRPYGWGTIMVVGMRMGGGNIYADTNKDDVVNSTDKQMKSAYVIMDISNPEEPPTVLAEITLPNLGYTTCYPTVIPMRSKSGSGSATTFLTNEWYLTFGSGPADANGYPASRDTAGAPDMTGTIGDPRVLSEGISLQDGKLFVISLNALTGTDSAGTGTKRVAFLNDLGASTDIAATTTEAHIEEFGAESYISQPITADYDLDFNADAVYFGTVEWDSTNSAWGGKLKRLIVGDSSNTADWVGTIGTVDRADNVLLDLTYSGSGISQPISAAPSVAVGKRVFYDIDANAKLDDFDRERWVFFGTGRFETRMDASDSSPQSYYGIKEPYNPAVPWGFTWEEVTRSSLLDSTLIDIWDDKRVDGHPMASVDQWGEMINEMEGPASYPGWYVDFLETNERNLGQAALLGGLLTFTTYMPSTDPCSTEGTSNLYARWYQTGTPFYKQIFKTGNTWVDDNGDGIQNRGETKFSETDDLGQGMALTPNIHTGREEGSIAYIQTSTGDIITIEQEKAEATKSNKTSWTQQR